MPCDSLLPASVALHAPLHPQLKAHQLKLCTCLPLQQHASRWPSTDPHTQSQSKDMTSTAKPQQRMQEMLGSSLQKHHSQPVLLLLPLLHTKIEG
jgi:hypothetical protein